MTNYQNS